MRETYEQAMAKVYVDEGGYTNDPVDPGGATNWGITIHDARMYWKADATPLDVRNMPKSVAGEIYRTKYAAKVAYDQQPAGLDYAVLDAGINSGIGRALPWEAAVLGTTNSGALALAAVAQQALKKQDVIHAYWAKRLAFLHSLRTWGHFGGGWGKRVASGEALSVRLWLAFGAKLTPPQQKVALDTASKKAASSGKKQTGSVTAQTTGGGAVAGSQASGWDSLSAGGKVALVGFCILLAFGLAWSLHWAIQHYRRSAAFAAEMEKVML